MTEERKDWLCTLVTRIRDCASSSVTNASVAVIFLWAVTTLVLVLHNPWSVQHHRTTGTYCTRSSQWTLNQWNTRLECQLKLKWQITSHSLHNFRSSPSPHLLGVSKLLQERYLGLTADGNGKVSVGGACIIMVSTTVRHYFLSPALPVHMYYFCFLNICNSATLLSYLFKDIIHCTGRRLMPTNATSPQHHRLHWLSPLMSCQASEGFSL